MTNEEIKRKLAVIVRNSLENLNEDLDSFTEESDLSSLKIDSIEFVKIVVGIEAEFDIDFDDDDLNDKKFQKLDDLVSYIKARLQA